MSKISELENLLDESLESFRQNIEFNYETFKGEYCTKDDMRELAKQTFYTLDQFKDHILNYLSSK